MPEVDLARIAAQLALDLHPLGTALTDAATHLAELSDLLPARGDARLEYDQLATIINYCNTLYHLADEKLADAAYAIDVPHPIPLHTRESEDAVDNVRAIESGVCAPGIANVLRRRDPMAQHENTPAVATRVNP